MSVVTAPSAFVPFTQTFVQGSVTTAIPLVGQILYNGKTNFVGYDAGSAAYIVPSTASGAQATTLANGNTYYITSGKAPTGYTLTAGGNGATTTGATTTSSGAATTAVSTKTSSPGTTSTSPGGIAVTGSAQTTTSTSSPTGNAAVITGPASGIEGLMLGFLTMMLGLLI
jgi:hypothetical protein